MPDWTLTAASVTKTLAQWGFNGPSLNLERINQASDVCTITLPEPMDVALLFPFRSLVSISRPDGSIFFQGRISIPVRDGSGDNESIQYRFEGPWFDLESVIFEQAWQQFNGYTTPGDPRTPPTFVTKTASEIFLGYKADGTRLNTGQQITEALNWAIGAGANLQIGTVGVATNFPYYNTRDLTCGEVVRQMLRWTPDAVAWFDYSTTPPTINIKRLSALTTATVTLGTEKIRSLQLRPRPDLILPACVLRYKIPNVTNGITFINIVKDVYPVGSVEQKLFNSVNTVELFGFQKTTVSATITTAPINANAGTNAARVAWWAGQPGVTKGKIPWLNNPAIDQSSIQITFQSAKDNNDVDVDLTQYPNELTDGQIASWMTAFNQKEVHLKATVSYTRLTAAGTLIPIQGAQDIPIHVTVKATNATSGTYSHDQSFEEGDPVPANLAQDIWTSRSVLQHEGQIDLDGQEIPAGFGMGQKLSINGLATAFDNLLVQQIAEEPFYGRMSIRVGPPRQLGIADLIELMRANRYRIIYNSPTSMQGSGQAAGEMSLGNNLPKQDSTTDSTPSGSFGVSKDQGDGTSAMIVKDAIGGSTNPPAASPQFVMQYAKNSDGTQIASQPSAIAKLSDITAAGVANKAVAFVLLKFKDPNNNCAPMKMLVWGTVPEPDV